MISCKRRLIPAMMAGALGLTGVTAFGQQTQPTQQELLDTVRELQAKVAQLEAKDVTSDHATQKLAADRVADAVLRDAERRSQLLAPSGFTAGYDKGKFLIQSEDGNNVLHPYVQFLFRHATTYREDDVDDGGEDTQNGFEVRRLKFGLDGNFISKDLTYHFLWATNRKSGNLVLEEAYGNYKFADHLAVQAGQFKNYFAHEAMSSSKRLFGGERTLLNGLFTGGDDFVQGVALLYSSDQIKGAISYTDGSNAPNENFQDFPTNDTNFGFAARVEYKVMGDWKSYEDFTAMGNKKDLLVIGAAADYTEAGDTGTLDHTVDAQLEVGQFSTYAAYLGRVIREGAGGDRYDFGAILQGGYLIDGKWEPFARYSYIHLDDGSVAAGRENNVHEISVGLNYFIHGHNAKITTDFTWLPNGSPVTDDGAAILATPDDSSEFVLRVQFQLLI